MKPTLTATRKCLQGLTGREVFALTLQHQLEDWTGQPATFSDVEIERMVAEFRRNPSEGRAYNAWWDMFGVIHHLATEARRIAMEATWRISLVSSWMLCQSQRMNRADETKRYPTTEDLRRIAKSLRYSQEMIDSFLRLDRLVEAFGQLHGGDIAVVVTRREREILRDTVEVCNHTIESFEDGLAFLAYCGDWVREDDCPDLPRLTLSPEDMPETLLETLTQRIESYYQSREYCRVVEGFDLALTL